MAYMICQFFHMDFWLLIIISSSILTSLQVAVCVVCYGVSETVFGEWSVMGSTIILVHSYYNVWLRAQLGWQSFLLRRDAVKVLPTHDASKVRASGSGLKTTGVPSSLPVKFNIDGKDAGPRREAQEANICDNHDGTYLVSYVPDMTDSCSVHPDSSPYATLNSNICQLCIQLEAFACCAEALGRDFRPLLTTWLYPVLEKAGEETLLVSQAALSSIWNINKRLSQHPQAPPVLTVLLTHSDCSLLVGDMVQDLDLSYERTAALFCSALHALMKALARWFPSTCSRTSTSASSRKSSSDQEDLSIRQFLLNYRKQKELTEGIGIEDDYNTEDREVPPTECEDVEDAGSPDVKAELPSHLSITKDVMERCIHLLSDPSLRLRLKVLDVLELCVQVLSERENELLPMAHRCWPALLQTLTADDPLAVLRAFRLKQT
ncbi:unnamed protein product [Oreochromis niloticus]|nr:unnamed protein product [Mustela putorius furo]